MSDLEDFKARHFGTVLDAFYAGDIPRLEELSQLSPFPRGTDGWLGRHWLTTAIGSCNPDAVAWVLSKNPKIDYIDDEGFTALKSALQVESDCKLMNSLSDAEAASLTIRLIDLLLDAGADINQPGTLGETALHVAAYWSSVPVVRHLLEKGADPTLWDDEYMPRQPADYAKIKKRWDVHAVLRDAMKAHPSGHQVDPGNGDS